MKRPRTRPKPLIGNREVDSLKFSLLFPGSVDPRSVKCESCLKFQQEKCDGNNQPIYCFSTVKRRGRR